MYLLIYLLSSDSDLKKKPLCTVLRVSCDF